MKQRLSTILLLLMMPLLLSAQVYRTQILSPKVMSLQAHLADAWNKAPVIELHSEQQVSISFDEMSHEYLRLAYRIRHCNADWQASSMNELDYLDGFSENDLPEGATSEATTVEYTHYELKLPNDDVRLKLSGNYVVEIFDRDAAEEEAMLLQVCFSVLDRKIGIDAKVSAQTDQAYNDKYQQLSFELQTPMGMIERPDSDIKILIRQNRRCDNQVFGIPPYMTSGNSIRYQHHPSLVFAAGNEYRRFEISSHKMAGMGVDRLIFERPYYHAVLFADALRNRSYTYDQDQNGRYYIRNREADALQTDYQMVHFSLPVDKPFAQALYLLGDIQQANPQAAQSLIYNEENRAYECQLLLKQGQYNYMYALAVSSRNSENESLSLSQTEGDFWPTANEYQIFVYYCPFAGEYDQLIGYQEVVFN